MEVTSKHYYFVSYVSRSTDIFEGVKKALQSRVEKVEELLRQYYKTDLEMDGISNDIEELMAELDKDIKADSTLCSPW